MGYLEALEQAELKRRADMDNLRSQVDRLRSVEQSYNSLVKRLDEIMKDSQAEWRNAHNLACALEDARSEVERLKAENARLKEIIAQTV